MSCLACASNNHVELSAAIVLNLATFQNADRACAELFPKLLVCLDCGFTRFNVSQHELASLAAGTQTAERLTRQAHP
jgi:hypothetical protein